MRIIQVMQLRVILLIQHPVISVAALAKAITSSQRSLIFISRGGLIFKKIHVPYSMPEPLTPLFIFGWWALSAPFEEITFSGTIVKATVLINYAHHLLGVIFPISSQME